MVVEELVLSRSCIGVGFGFGFDLGLWSLWQTCMRASRCLVRCKGGCLEDIFWEGLCLSGRASIAGTVWRRATSQGPRYSTRIENNGIGMLPKYLGT